MSETADSLSAFTRAGFAPADAASRAELMDLAAAGLRGLTGAPAEWRWFVPGRLELFGTHCDYGGGPTLVGATPRGFAVAASPRPDGRVRVLDARHRESLDIDLRARRPIYGWRRYAATVIVRLASNFPGAPLGIDIAFASDLPRAAGLSSSSALMVGVASALARRGGLANRDEWRRSIPSSEACAEYLSCIENGHSYRSLEGAAGVGTQGGSEDHAAILLGRAGCLMQFAFVPVRTVAPVPLAPGWRFVIATSGVHADKAGSVRDRYNRASRALRALFELARAEVAGAFGAASLGELLDRDPAAVERLTAVVRRHARGDFTSDELLRRLTHFVNERARVPQAAAAFAAADAARIGELARATQTEADTLLGNQVPETIDLAQAAREAGAAAAAAFGAGFGGSVWALLTGGEDDAAFATRWLDLYRARHPHRTTQWFSAAPGPGALEIAEA